MKFFQVVRVSFSSFMKASYFMKVFFVKDFFP